MESIRQFFDSQDRLIQFPARRKKKLPALFYLAGKFQPGKVYSEAEVNALLESWHTFHDPATLRRELYDLRFLDRTPEGTAYRLADPQPEFPSA